MTNERANREAGIDPLQARRTQFELPAADGVEPLSKTQARVDLMNGCQMLSETTVRSSPETLSNHSRSDSYGIRFAQRQPLQVAVFEWKPGVRVQWARRCVKGRAVAPPGRIGPGEWPGNEFNYHWCWRSGLGETNRNPSRLQQNLLPHTKLFSTICQISSIPWNRRSHLDWCVNFQGE